MSWVSVQLSWGAGVSVYLPVYSHHANGRCSLSLHLCDVLIAFCSGSSSVSSSIYGRTDYSQALNSCSLFSKQVTQKFLNNY